MLLCSLNTHAVKADMTSIYIEGKEIQRVHTYKHLRVSFDRKIFGKEYFSKITIKAPKGLVAPKTVACARMSQKILIIQSQALIHKSVFKFGLELFTISATQLKRLETIQNEAMRVNTGMHRGHLIRSNETSFRLSHTARAA